MCLLDPHPTFSSDVHRFFDMVKSIYLDPHGRVKQLEHHSQLGIELKYIQWEVNMSSFTLDSSLWMSSLDYFSIIVGTCTWDTNYFNMAIKT